MLSFAKKSFKGDNIHIRILFVSEWTRHLILLIFLKEIDKLNICCYLFERDKERVSKKKKPSELVRPIAALVEKEEKYEPSLGIKLQPSLATFVIQ